MAVNLLAQQPDPPKTTIEAARTAGPKTTKTAFHRLGTWRIAAMPERQPCGWWNPCGRRGVVGEAGEERSEMPIIFKLL